MIYRLKEPPTRNDVLKWTQMSTVYIYHQRMERKKKEKVVEENVHELYISFFLNEGGGIR